MVSVVVPSKLESHVALADGSEGFSLIDLFSFKQEKVDNLYSYNEKTDDFHFAFQEHGTAYKETEPSNLLSETKLVVPGKAEFSLQFDPQPVEVWGINFAASVRVIHGDSSEARVVYLPGTRTYDPAGLTGDPHASERIGPSCSRTQAAVSASSMFAALHGAGRDQLDAIQQCTRPAILRYHGRQCLFDWMHLQVQEAIYLNKDVTPYPEFIKSEVRKGKLSLSDARQHTKAYLQSYNMGKPHPPHQFFKKVAAKDPIKDIFTEEQLESFKKLAM